MSGEKSGENYTMVEIEHFPADMDREDGRAGLIKQLTFWLNADNTDWVKFGELRYGDHDCEAILEIGGKRFYVSEHERSYKSGSTVLCIIDE